MIFIVIYIDIDEVASVASCVRARSVDGRAILVLSLTGGHR